MAGGEDQGSTSARRGGGAAGEVPRPSELPLCSLTPAISALFPGGVVLELPAKAQLNLFPK